MNVDEVKTEIVNALKKSGRPLMVSDIEAMTHLPWYTINHYIMMLVKENRIKMSILGRKTRIFELPK